MPDGESGQPLTVTFDHAAFGAWEAWYNRNQRELSKVADTVAGAWLKMPSQAARLILISHLTRWAAGEVANPDVIDKQSVDCGTAIADYFKGHLTKVYGTLYADPQEARQRRVVDWIRRRDNPGLRPRDLVTFKVAQIKTADEAKKVLSELVLLAVGEWRQPVPRPGKQGPERFYLK